MPRIAACRLRDLALRVEAVPSRTVHSPGWRVAAQQEGSVGIALTIVITAVLTLGAVLAIQVLIASRREYRYELTNVPELSDPGFRRRFGSLFGSEFVSGNQVRILTNGVEILPAMLAAIRSAEKTVTFENYLFWPGEVALQFSEALAERARAGVQVRVLLDFVGSHSMDPAHARLMEDAGVRLKKFRPPRWYNLGRMNRRTHRRLLILDGRLGYVGGLGIGDAWQGNADSPDHWRESQLEVRGPVVGQLQSAFLKNWIEVSSEVLDSDEYFPAIQSDGSADCQLFSSRSSSRGDPLWLMYLLCFTAARDQILLANAYFSPHRRAVSALVAARKRGVRVEILIPGPHLDVKATRRASRAEWGELLEHGVEIYLYQPTMFHPKYLIIDERFLSLGSANFDERSFRLNDEANLNVYDRETAQQQIEAFESDKRNARRYTLQEWKNRSWKQRATESVYGMMRWQI